MMHSNLRIMPMAISSVWRLDCCAFLNQSSFDYDVKLIANSRKEYHHAVNAFGIVLEHSNEVAKRAIFYCDLITESEFFAGCDIAVFHNFRLNDRDNLVSYRTGAAPETDHTMDSSTESNLAQVVGLKLGEDIPREQGFDQIRLFTCVLIGTAFPQLWSESLHLPTSQITVSAAFLLGFGMNDIPLRSITRVLVAHRNFRTITNTPGLSCLD